MSTALTRRQRPSRGDELELTIDSLAFGGNGVARHEGYVVFVVAACARESRGPSATTPKR
jgi:23S rRNA (uracil1939-C5)-methyltransferase